MVEVVGATDRRRFVTDHRRMTDRPVDVVRGDAVVRVIVRRGRRGRLERQLAHERSCRQRGRGSEQLSSREAHFSHD